MSDNVTSDKNRVELQEGRPTPASGDDGPQRHAAEVERHGKGMPIFFVIGLLLSVAAVGYIILDGADDAVFAYTVDQAVQQQGDLVGKKFRVRGNVQEGTVKATPGTLNSQFDLIHEGKTITVTYNKALPDTFKPGLEVIAEGELGDNGVLAADNIIAKCPSKYEEGAPNVGKHPSNIPKTL